jgi:hypothetical protein
MAVEPNMQKNMKNDLIHTNHRQGEKSEIKILARESSIVRENSVSLPAFLIPFANNLKNDRILVAVIAFIMLPSAEKNTALHLSVVIYNPNLRHTRKKFEFFS